VHTNWPVQAASLPYHSPARRLLNAATRGRLYVSVHMPHAAIFFPGAFLPDFAFLMCFSVWQAEEAVANLPVRLAVRVHCGHQACAQHDGAHARFRTQRNAVFPSAGVLKAYSRGAHSLYGYSCGWQRAPSLLSARARVCG
jgi:hypothetical protein